MKRTSIFTLIVGLVFFCMLFFGFSGCSEDEENPGILNVRLVDAPITLNNGMTVEEVNVVITRVDVVRKGSGESNSDEIKSGDGVITVLETETELNLLEYVDGASALLGTVEIDPGEYLQLRLVVDVEQSTIKFADDDTEYYLQIPSGGESGIKIKGNGHNPLFVIEEDQEADLVIDFDAQLSIIAGVEKDNYKLRPVIKEVKFRNQVVNNFETEGVVE